MIKLIIAKQPLHSIKDVGPAGPKPQGETLDDVQLHQAEEMYQHTLGGDRCDPLLQCQRFQEILLSEDIHVSPFPITTVYLLEDEPHHFPALCLHDVCIL